MGGKIYLEGKHVDVASVDIGFGHMYLVYNDGQEHVIRGGPETVLSFPPFIIDTIAGALLADSLDNRPASAAASHGQIQIDLGGRDAADVWNIMLQQANAIDAARLQYAPGDQNSNSVVASVLNVVGL